MGYSYGFTKILAEGNARHTLRKAMTTWVYQPSFAQESLPGGQDLDSWWLESTGGCCLQAAIEKIQQAQSVGSSRSRYQKSVPKAAISGGMELAFS